MKNVRYLVALAILSIFGCETSPATTTETDAGMADAGAADAGPPPIDPAVLAVCEAVGPGFAQACDVERSLITVDASEPTPAYGDLFPGIDAYNMNGWEWWQQWPGGHEPTFEYEEASPAGITCSVASALRFAAIMQDPPEVIAQLRAETTWEGRFYNWNDDFSDPASVGDGTGSMLWAWQDYLIKWISQTNRDGSCYLPTRSMLLRAGESCLEVGAANAGNIQDCYAE